MTEGAASMSGPGRDVFADVEAGIDALLDRLQTVSSPLAEAETLVTEAEGVIANWIIAKGGTPTTETVEGYRLLALHRQAARGEPSFNACRETAREIVFLRNVIALYTDDRPQALHHLRLQAMVLRHLSLFIGGKLQEAGLGDFCCSSRPIRSASAVSIQSGAGPAGTRP